MIAEHTWRISSLRIHNFRNISRQEIVFSPQVTLLIGENGAGKTAVLDAAKVMLSTVVSELGGESAHFSHNDVRTVDLDLDSRQKAATSEPHYPVGAEIEFIADGNSLEWRREIRSPKGRTSRGDLKVRNHFSKLKQEAIGEPVYEYERNQFDELEKMQKSRRDTYSNDLEKLHSTTLPVIAYYGVDRMSGTRRASGRIPKSRTGAYASALDPRSDLSRLSAFIKSLNEQILYAVAYGDPIPESAQNQFRAIEMACDRVIGHTGWTGLRWNPHLDALTLRHDDFGTQPLSHLSSGTRIAAGLAIDLASRMARANPHLGSEALLSSTPGIVMVDEIDLHLHPRWQKKIVPTLRSAFPAVQFILTSHSPHVIATVESQNVRILKDHMVEVPSFGYGLLPEKILELLQNTDPEPNIESRKIIDQYMSLVNQREGGTSRRAIELRSQIENLFGGVELVPELLKADALLAFDSLEFDGDDWEVAR
ncbi:AAA family ATPase [Kocuria palustris]|uniref:AAA family ATPase n=1 Tax=Kocuria palustris TaxID=71999 RepID=UPI003653673D